MYILRMLFSFWMFTEGDLGKHTLKMVMSPSVWALNRGGLAPLIIHLTSTVF